MLPIVEEIRSQIMAKANVYQLVVERTHRIPSDEAVKVITGELEIYLNRLESYLSDPKNSGATITAIQGANIFLDVMEMGLSFSTVVNHVYVSRMKGTGTAVGYKVTKEGAIYLAQCAGAIDHCSEAVIVWKGEEFSISNSPDGHEIANHVQRFDNKPPFNIEQMLVGYVYVVYPNGDRELSRISGTRMKELMAKSQKPAMYNDESFIETKIVKHALRSVRMKPFSAQSQLSDDDSQSSTQATPHVQPQAPAQQPFQVQAQPQTFQNQPQQPLYMPPGHPINQQQHAQPQAQGFASFGPDPTQQLQPQNQQQFRDPF